MIKDHPRIDKIFYITYLPFFMMEEAGNDRMIIGGDPGDICFGSKMYRHDQVVWDKEGNVVTYDVDPWAKAWEGVPPHHRELFQPMVDKCPIEIENNYDLTWWLGFCIKWQLTETRLPMMARFNIPNFYNFFSSTDCQLWAMNNNSHIKCPDQDWSNLKHPTKEHLHLFWSDDSVWKQVKRDSLQYVWSNLMIPGGQFIDFLHEVINPDQALKDRVPDLKYFQRAAKTFIDQTEGKIPYSSAGFFSSGKRPPRGQFGETTWIDENWVFNDEWPDWGGLIMFWKRVELDGKY
jgi:hypothetical protein